MTSDADTDTWLTYADAAQRLGVSTNAIKQRVKRGKMLAARGNDGQPRVSIWGRAADTDTAKQNRQTPTPATPGEPMMPVAQAMAMVVQERARHATDMAQERAETARRLAEVQTMHLDAIGRMQAQAAVERSLWLERVDAAELRAERVEQRLDQVLDHLLQRQPDRHRESWWRRLFGSSTKSDLGG